VLQGSGKSNGEQKLEISSDVVDFMMRKYRVDFYIGVLIVGYVNVMAVCRRDAWIDSWETVEYKEAQCLADEFGVDLFFDATEV
jgi:hypothetical protein